MATAPKHGLGKGLSALISENYVQPAPAKAKEDSASGTNNGLMALAVNQLAKGKYQPRTQFSDESLAELAQSIEKNGIMQPIIVRPAQQAGRYEVIAGERRWRAAKIAGLSSVPVLVREINDKQALELAIVENVQRQDLSPLEESLGYQRLIEEFDYTQEEIAHTVGKSRSHITNLLRLLSLPDEVKDMIDRGELTMGHARALAGAPNPLELAREIVKRGLNARQVEQASRELQGHEHRPNARRQQAPKGPMDTAYRPPINKDPDIVALEESLSENLGVRVAIHDRGQSGEIILAYDSLAQLDDILRRLSANADSEELI